MSIKCSADCSPKCVYVWSRGSAVKQNVSSTDGVLTLVTVGPEDAGNYRCTARNSIGLEATTEVTVVVQSEFSVFVLIVLSVHCRFLDLSLDMFVVNHFHTKFL